MALLEFKSDVWDTANTGYLHALVTALASHPHLIDTPHPHKLRQTPMYIAAAKGHVEIITKLVELGSHAIDTPDTNGWTPMYAAAWKGNVSAIETLVRLGSTAIDTPCNNDGWTPMYAAASNGHVSVIETLVRLGSTAIDTPNNYGRTPVHMAASQGYVSAIETLVRLGSNAIDTPDTNGCTPMYAAARNDHGAGAVKTLKLLGADCSTTTHRATSAVPDCSYIPSNVLSSRMVELLNARVNEGESAKVRYRVYFRQSLVGRLLEVDVQHHRRGSNVRGCQTSGAPSGRRI